MKTPELVNVLGIDGSVIDVVTRDEAEQDNHTTENVLVFVFNSLGKVWIHKRRDSNRQDRVNRELERPA